MTSYTMKKTRDSIKHMIDLNEEFVWKQDENGSVKRISVEDAKVGDKIVVHTGEKICVDGKIISGEAIVDESAVTGEYVPHIKKIGSEVYSGTLVKNGNIVIDTQRAGDDTVVSRIINLVEDAACNKARVQDYADKFSNYLIPFNFFLAGATYLATKSPTRALNMMVIDYSCGIKLSTATAFSATINNAVKNGILIKGGNYIEALAEADTLILDKTGTLTEGKPEVLDIVTKDGIKSRELLEIAAAAEETSAHPMASAILSKVRSEGIKIPMHGEIITHIAALNTSPKVFIPITNPKFSFTTFIVFLDKFITAGSAIGSSVCITTSDVSIAASVQPPPNDTPTSAYASAGASFMPSPTIITLEFLDCSLSIVFALSSGSSSASYPSTPTLLATILA